MWKCWALVVKAFGSLPVPRSGYATTIIVFFAHLLILECPDCHQNLISSSLYYPGTSIKFHPNPFITFWVTLSPDKQTNQRYQKHNLLYQAGNKEALYIFQLLYGYELFHIQILQEQTSVIHP